MLSEIKSTLTKQGPMTLHELSQQLRCPISALRPMLSTWIKKGRVVQTRKTEQCGSACTQCNPAFTEVFYWQS